MHSIDNTPTTREEDDALIGTLLDGRFRIDSVVGSGGMSVVYKAFQPLMQRVVAVKVMHGNLSFDELVADRFRREVLAASALDHPGIVKVFASGSTADGRAYLVMDLVAGRPLSELIGKPELKWRRVVEIAVRLCESLEYAHQSGVIHRDIKPSNVMIKSGESNQDYPILLDFGVAQVFSAGNETEPPKRLTRTTRGLAGTPSYMAPELCMKKQGDARVDIYSLGCMLYEMISGYPPFQGESGLDVMYKHSHSSIPALDPAHVVPAELRQIIQTCLAKDPDQRFQSMNDLREALIKTGDAEEPEKTAIPVLSSRKFRICVRSISIAFLLLLTGSIAILLFCPDGLVEQIVYTAVSCVSGGTKAERKSRSAKFCAERLGRPLAASHLCDEAAASSHDGIHLSLPALRYELQGANILRASSNADAFDGDARRKYRALIREVAATAETAEPLPFTEALIIANQAEDAMHMDDKDLDYAYANDAFAISANAQARGMMLPAIRWKRKAISVRLAVRGPGDQRLVGEYLGLGLIYWACARAQFEKGDFCGSAARAYVRLCRDQMIAGSRLALRSQNLDTEAASAKVQLGVCEYYLGHVAEGEKLVRDGVAMSLRQGTHWSLSQYRSNFSAWVNQQCSENVVVMPKPVIVLLQSVVEFDKKYRDRQVYVDSCLLASAYAHDKNYEMANKIYGYAYRKRCAGEALKLEHIRYLEDWCNSLMQACNSNKSRQKLLLDLSLEEYAWSSRLDDGVDEWKQNAATRYAAAEKALHLPQTNIEDDAAAWFESHKEKSKPH